MNSKNKMLTTDDFFVREFRGCDVTKIERNEKIFFCGNTGKSKRT